MNEILFLFEALAMFTALLCFKKMFGKNGLYAWIAIASVLANVQVTKTIELFGVTSAVSNVLFATIFLATDLLRECYGKDDAKHGAYIGSASILAFMLIAQITKAYAPADIDIAHGAMTVLFDMSFRVCFASLLMFAVSTLLSITLYDWLHRLCDGKKLWLRNNVSTIVSNCVDNFGFAFLAFAGVYPAEDIIMIAASGCVVEIIAALLDTPFAYLGKKIGESSLAK